MIRTIMSWYDGRPIWSGEGETVKDAIHAALATRANLRGADLRGANLHGANLTGADLRGADLTRANLRGANLRGADLTRANLSGANLRGADLTRANLSGADLRGATLRGADLRGADLRDANLHGANLTGVNLTGFRNDLYAVLSDAPAEVRGLLAAIRAGQINGSTYQGECACLVGTIANVRGCSYQRLGALVPDSSRPAEVWFMGIAPGDTPATNFRAQMAEQWIAEWLARMEAAFSPAS